MSTSCLSITVGEPELRTAPTRRGCLDFRQEVVAGPAYGPLGVLVGAWSAVGFTGEPVNPSLPHGDFTWEVAVSLGTQ